MFSLLLCRHVEHTFMEHKTSVTYDVANFDSPSVSAVGLPSSKEGVSIIAVASRVWCLSPVGSEKVSLLSKYQKLHILYISIIIHYTLDS